jgi:hypothetical protein
MPCGCASCDRHFYIAPSAVVVFRNLKSMLEFLACGECCSRIGVLVPHNLQLNQQLFYNTTKPVVTKRVIQVFVESRNRKRWRNGKSLKKPEIAYSLFHGLAKA